MVSKVKRAHPGRGLNNPVFSNLVALDALLTDASDWFRKLASSQAGCTKQVLRVCQRTFRATTAWRATVAVLLQGLHHQPGQVAGQEPPFGHPPLFAAHDQVAHERVAEPVALVIGKDVVMSTAANSAT